MLPQHQLERVLVVSGTEKVVHLYDPDGLDEVGTFPTLTKNYRSVAVMDGDLVAISESDSVRDGETTPAGDARRKGPFGWYHQRGSKSLCVAFFHAFTGELAMPMRTIHTGRIRGLGVARCMSSPGSCRVVSGDTNSHLYVSDGGTGDLLAELNGPPTTQIVTFLGSAEEGVFVGGTDNAVRLFDLETTAVMQEFIGHKRPLWGIAGDEKVLYTGCAKGEFRVWDRRTALSVQTVDFGQYAGWIINCPDLSSVIVGGSEIRVLETRKLGVSQIRRFKPHDRWGVYAMERVGKRRFVSVSEDHHVVLFEDSGKVLKRQKTNNDNYGVALIDPTEFARSSRNHELEEEVLQFLTQKDWFAKPSLDVRWGSGSGSGKDTDTLHLYLWVSLLALRALN